MSSTKTCNTVDSRRRTFLGDVGRMTLSASAVGLLAACETTASQQAQSSDPAADVSILNVALGLEHEAIAAYQLGAESGLLQKPVLEVAVLFQSHHKGHRDALAATIRRLGGNPVDAKTMQVYASELNAGAIKNQADILALAKRLELGAANAYLGVIPNFNDAALAQISGRIAADETMHWTALAQATGEALPAKPLTFGA